MWVTFCSWFINWFSSLSFQELFPQKIISGTFPLGYCIFSRVRSSSMARLTFSLLQAIAWKDESQSHW